MTDETQRSKEREREPAQRSNVDKIESGKSDWDRDEMQERSDPPKKKSAGAGWMRALVERVTQWLRPGGAFGGDDDASPTPA